MASSNTTVTVSGHNAQWEWEGDKSIWQQYPINIQQDISQAFDAGNKDVDVNVTDQISMTIKFSDMVQVNKKTKFMRRIRLCLELKDENGFFVYEWQNENKKWETYIAEIMIKIADAINNDQTTLSVTCQSRSYDIDLKKLIQTNTSTNVTRKIHRIKSMAKLPSNTSTISNKRSLENDEEPTESTTKKRAVSASSGAEKSSVRTVTTVAGQAPVDAECKTLIGKVHVYTENKDIFDCMLNQTNIGNNNNKFYLIQLLEDNNSKKYHVWLRWGRVGYTGQTYLESFGGNLDNAKRVFCQKHGSRLTNFAGIMSQGLRIAPPEAPITGHMFGKGLYFADMSSKSANYCYPDRNKNTGLLLLSEVALGKWNELTHADINANKLPAGLSSVKGLGSVAPNEKNQVKIDGDLIIPMGPAESATAPNAKYYTLNYNEFIVYDTKQVRMRYLIKLKFLFQ
ncbi:unnamed protein product [Rotaria sp. Silwood1]|nr:unnamed protein product [Rotaria sp. Silwood1]